MKEWSGRVLLKKADIDRALLDKLEVFRAICGGMLPDRPLQFPDGRTFPGLRRTVTKVWVPGTPPNTIYVSAGEEIIDQFPITRYSQDGQRLYADLLISLEAECWKDLAKRVGTEPADTNTIQVFISYRKRPEIEGFAEAVALRLEQEGILARFDKWDMAAGDSLPGRIEEALRASRACLIVLSDDYTSGSWATVEMEAAIVKRAEGRYRVVPVLFEQCSIPALLAGLVRVDFSAHDPDEFEVRMREVIRGVLGISGRPFGAR